MKRRTIFSDSRDPLDLTLMGDVDAALHSSNHPWAFTLTLAVFLFFGVVYIWADNTMIDDVVRGSGKVIPAEGVRDIQSDTGGTISEVTVREGDEVDANFVVAVIANQQDVSALQDLQNMSAELGLSLVRLQAEAEGKEPVFTEEQQKNFPRIVESQLQIFAANKEKFAGEDNQLLAEITQRKKEVELAEESQKKFTESLAVLKEEEAAKAPLAGTAVSIFDFRALQERIIVTEGDLASVEKTIARAQSAANAAQQRLQTRKYERLKSIAVERNTNRVKKEEIDQRVNSWSDQVSRANLTSPVHGIVKNIILKEGAIAQPAEVIMQIIPRGDVLEIEARFAPADRGFLFVGQKGMAKFTAYDFAIYGGLEAKVTRISDDTILDRRGAPWYEVRLVTEKKHISYQGREYPILPGMTVGVDLLTDKRSVVANILGPLRRAQQNAMTEH